MALHSPGDDMRPLVLIVLLAAFVAPPLSGGADAWIELFNGRDLAGWHLRKPDGPNLWKAVDGVYATAAKGTDLQTDRDFYNFELHVEFRIAPGTNSGIYMRDRYEIQIADSHGKPAAQGGCGALYRRIPPAVVACKPVGEWESFDITFFKQRLTVHHNGQKVLDNVETGPKGTGASSARDDAPGPLRLQGDHGAISFRNVRIRPIADAEGSSLLAR